MSDEYNVSVKEAAERLRVSKRTVRRKLKSGKLDGKKKESPYGKMWFVSEDEFNQAEAVKEIVDVAEVNQPIPVEKLKEAFKMANQPLVEKLIEENKAREQKRKKNQEELKQELKQELKEVFVRENQQLVEEVKQEFKKEIKEEIKEEMIKKNEKLISEIEKRDKKVVKEVKKSMEKKKEEEKGFFKKLFGL